MVNLSLSDRSNMNEIKPENWAEEPEAVSEELIDAFDNQERYVKGIT
jgi:hypothetical protein